MQIEKNLDLIYNKVIGNICVTSKFHINYKEGGQLLCTAKNR